jgi:hypothetical protein
MANDIDNNNSWNLISAHVPLADQKLEQVLNTPEDELDKEEDLTQAAVRTMSDPLIDTIIRIHRHKRDMSSGEIERLTIKLGLAVMNARFGKQIDQIAGKHAQIYDDANKIIYTKSLKTNQQFQFLETLSTSERKISLRKGQSCAIKDQIADPLHLYFSTSVQLTLLAGLSRSEVLIPRSWVTVFLTELDNFQDYLDKRLEPLAKILKG